MYVEISSRHSGKTRRLVEAADRHLKENWANIAVIVCPSIRQAEYFKQRICSLVNFGARVRCADTMRYRLQPGDELTRLKFFVHDFEDIAERELYIHESGYYVTSLKRRRKPGERDFLTALVEANGGRYSQYGFGGDYRELLDRIGEKAFKRETQMEVQAPDRYESNKQTFLKIQQTAAARYTPELLELVRAGGGKRDGLAEIYARVCYELGIYLEAEDDAAR